MKIAVDLAPGQRLAAEFDRRGITYTIVPGGALARVYTQTSRGTATTMTFHFSDLCASQTLAEVCEAFPGWQQLLFGDDASA